MKRGSRRRDGFTLAEAVASLAIAAILAAAAVPAVLRLIEISEERTTRARLERVEEGLLAFYRDHGRFPTDDEGLEALLVDPGTGSWHGPYLPPGGTGENPLEDGRGHPLVYAGGRTSCRVVPPGFPDLAVDGSAAPVVLEWVARAREEIARLNDAAEDWRDVHGSYPASVDDLVPGILGADYGTDPWGHPYRVDAGRETFYSAGPDGTPGTADDVHAPGL